MSGGWFGPMRQALEEAEKGRYGASPNPMVGAVLLSHEGEVVSVGAHLRCGGPHAEVAALAGGAGKTVGGTIVTTVWSALELTGRQPSGSLTADTCTES